MATAETPAQTFFQSFLGPLVQGTEVTIGLPIERSTWDELAAIVETHGDEVVSIELALQMHAERILAGRTPVRFDLDALRMAVALHQLLFSFHAAAEQGRVSEGRLTTLVADITRMLGEVTPTREVDRLVLYHLIVDPFFLVYREDVAIFFRLGEKHFYGQEVDWIRLPFRWRVQYEEKTGTDVATSIFARTAGQAFAALLRLTPLTRLLRADRLFEELTFDDLDGVLDDQTLCRYAINTIVDRGLASFMPGLAVGFHHLCQTSGSRREVARAARFLVTLALTEQFWHPDTDARRMLDARYLPPSNAMRFDSPEVDADAARSGDTDQSRRQRFNHEGWALVTALLDRPDVVRLPEPDANAASTAALRQRLETLQPHLGEAPEQARRLITHIFPR